MPLSYAALTPDVVLDACDSAGFRADGRLLPHHSYENRVYRSGWKRRGAVVLKFYRPAAGAARQIAKSMLSQKNWRRMKFRSSRVLYREHAGFSFAGTRAAAAQPGARVPQDL